MAEPQEHFYTVEQIAELLQIHWQSVLNYIKRGELEAIRIGRGYRISNTSLYAFLRHNSTKRNRQ